MPYVGIGSARGKATLVVVCMALLVIVTNNTILNVYTLLSVANLTAVNGVPWGGSLAGLRPAAFLVFFTLNEQGVVS